MKGLDKMICAKVESKRVYSRMSESKARTIKQALSERDRLNRLIRDNYSDEALSRLCECSKRVIQDIHAERSWSHIKI